jgi:S-formylglutathione hydrolase FrmB
MTRLLGIAAAISVAIAAVLAYAPAAHAASAPVEGISVLESTQINSRLTDFSMQSSVLPSPVHVRILLPAGYAADPRRRYPVLYLMPGGFGQTSDWTELGNAERITANAPLIIAMPSDGNGGWCTNWYNGGLGGPPEWETFHIDQLIPWVDASYRTIAARNGRAIAGVSSGGFCAMSYAARHPDMFVWAGSFSGAVSIVNNPALVAVIAAEAIADGGGPLSVFGSPVTNQIVWQASNPVNMAANLQGMGLYLATGNGRPGPLDAPGTGVSLIEQQIYQMNLAFHQQLLALGINHVWNYYGPGTHTWPYWQRDLTEALPLILATFANPPPAPSTFTYTSAEATYAVYGWQVALQPPVMAWSTLQVQGPGSFALTGTGVADVVTPPDYQPGSVHSVLLQAGQLTRTEEITADQEGQLHLTVPLGSLVQVPA